MLCCISEIWPWTRIRICFHHCVCNLLSTLPCKHDLMSTSVCNWSKFFREVISNQVQMVHGGWHEVYIRYINRTSNRYQWLQWKRYVIIFNFINILWNWQHPRHISDIEFLKFWRLLYRFFFFLVFFFFLLLLLFFFLFFFFFCFCFFFFSY